MDEERKKIRLSIQEALPKIEHYCAYQERCHKEVSSKLYEYGLNSTEVMELLQTLVKKGFLNEERFAKAFAGGKFRQKGWGRNKIIRELKSRDISEYCIKKAMQEIDSEDYGKSLEKTAIKYIEAQKKLKPWELKQKTLRYLISRGYEYDQCHEILDRIIHP